MRVLGLGLRPVPSRGARGDHELASYHGQRGAALPTSQGPPRMGRKPHIEEIREREREMTDHKHVARPGDENCFVCGVDMVAAARADAGLPQLKVWHTQVLRR